jgi:Domain of unknown function (DUF1929)/Galactose oxidase, central domain
MALLRGNADSSWVLHWHFGSSSRLWLAEPLKDTTRSVAVPIDTLNELNTFCAGQTILADGRLMVVGGTVVGTTGENRTPIFDAKSYTNSTRGWTTTVDAMEHGRWYATATVLATGKVLATSGSEFKRMHLFGGTRDSSGVEALKNDFRPLHLKSDPYWEDDQAGLANRPEPRFGHSVVFHYDRGRIVYFGGVRDSAGQNVLTNQVRQKFIFNVNSGHQWQWQVPTVAGDSTHGFPLPRYRHSAVIVDNVMIVYGGLGRTATGVDTVLSDVWRLILNDNNQYQWKRDAAWASPGPRYGHSAVIDGDEDGGLEPAMLVYGGIAAPPEVQTFWGAPASGSWASDVVWALELDRVDEAAPVAWTQIASGGPGKRQGHVAVMDTIDSHPLPSVLRHRMVVFGGDSLGTLTNSVWLLSRPEPIGSGSWTWSLLAPSGTWPAARAHHQGVYDAEWQRLLVFGGDSDLGQGGETADLWALPLDVGTPSWSSLDHGNAPSARKGAAAVFDPRPVPAKVPEIFTPGGNGDWAVLPGAAKWQDNYPFIFQTKSSVFYAGNSSLIKSDSSYVLVGESWSDAKSSGFYGGSSALSYTAAGAEVVMKCGAPDHYKETQMSVVTKTATVDSADGSTEWEARLPLPTNRRLHNLTFVPDGRLLISAGWSTDPTVQNPNPTYALTPHFYENGQWGTGLADDLASRSYHSTIVLLPDGRLVAAGGPPTDMKLTASVFWPPYLFKNGTELATRPAITSYPTDAKHYGEPFYVDLDLGDQSPVDSIAILSLIRPGAVTHGFDMNQRYLALPFAVMHGRLRAELTGNANQLPPGDYLLFAVRTGVGGVPSVGQWLRIESESDAIRPAGNDVQATGSSQSMILAWVAPGDDSLSGTASAYELRYRTDGPVTEGNFSGGTLVNTYPPRPAGEEEVYTVPGLSTCTTYYFGLKTRDEKNQWSALETASASTGCSGGGGGGCEFCEELPPSARPAAGYVVTHQEVQRFGDLPVGGGIVLTHSGTTAFQVDSLELIEVAHAADSMVVAHGGELWLGAVEPATEVVGSAGDVTETLAGSGYAAAAGETLSVGFATLGEAAAGSALVFETESETGSGSVRVSIPRDEQRWRAIAQVTPSVGLDKVVVEDVGSDRVRLVFGESRRLRRVARVTPRVVAGSRGTVELKETMHSRLGDVAAPVGGSGVVLESGEMLRLKFAGAGLAADRFLRYRVSSAGSSPARQRQVTANLPPTIALEQNQPNPFARGR